MQKQGKLTEVTRRCDPGRGSGGNAENRRVITKDTPLTPTEQQFIANYIDCGNAAKALRDTGLELKNSTDYKRLAFDIIRQPNVQAQLQEILESIKLDTIATTQEILGYFTAVMRGEVKDQFGLDAPLSERTRAAQELAKRTIDLENRANGKSDQNINITVDWARKLT